MYVFQLFDFFTGSRIITLVAVSQLGAVLAYGADKWYNGLALMLGFRPGLYIKVPHLRLYTSTAVPLSLHSMSDIAQGLGEFVAIDRLGIK